MHDYLLDTSGKALEHLERPGERLLTLADEPRQKNARKLLQRIRDASEDDVNDREEHGQVERTARPEVDADPIRLHASAILQEDMGDEVGSGGVVGVVVVQAGEAYRVYALCRRRRGG